MEAAKSMRNYPPLKGIEWLLRVGVFLTFLGHGYLAFCKNPAWIPYLQTAGFSLPIAYTTLMLIGLLDIAVAVIVLLKPNKYVVLWAIFWTFSTALIRPISGEPIWSFIERGSNWIVPLSLYILMGLNQKKALLKSVSKH